MPSCIQSITRRQPPPTPAGGGQAPQATSPYAPLEWDKGEVEEADDPGLRRGRLCQQS
ncbi:MAG: hypothetical protein ABFD75_07645 [Smithella sp.]